MATNGYTRQRARKYPAFLGNFVIVLLCTGLRINFDNPWRRINLVPRFSNIAGSLVVKSAMYRGIQPGCHDLGNITIR